ncbi:unnamed protein product [Acanthosepion pharaonis]|uniref:Uncharacterized protein n=1 Tax=Acanthosepion pharaonis TaxID=158019 RepID=A0A812EA31_ACAPH|nr:unnamed protein product [Sepia pharaonis]
MAFSNYLASCVRSVVCISLYVSKSIYLSIYLSIYQSIYLNSYRLSFSRFFFLVELEWPFISVELHKPPTGAPFLTWSFISFISEQSFSEKPLRVVVSPLLTVHEGYSVLSPFSLVSSFHPGTLVPRSPITRPCLFTRYERSSRVKPRAKSY